MRYGTSRCSHIGAILQRNTLGVHVEASLARDGQVRRRVTRSKVVELPHGRALYGEDLIAEVMSIGPTDAGLWLKANTLNRPHRKRLTARLAQQMIDGQWQLNGQAIVISKDEQILDGQHRLQAVLASGKTIRSLVVYGITREAFKTMDTGAARSPSDALYLHFRGAFGTTLEAPNVTVVKAAATAAQWCNSLDSGSLHRTNFPMSNTSVIEYIEKHPTIIQCAERLSGFDKHNRPLSLGSGTALFEMFRRKDASLAELYMSRLYSGEGLSRKDPEYYLRSVFTKDASKRSRLPQTLKMHMVVKGWNWIRRSMGEANYKAISVTTSERPPIKIA